jgi:hypothetical protein
MVRIDFKDINKEDFLVTNHYIAGQLCHFVRPRPTYFDWNAHTLHYRSAIYFFNGDLISASFPKFFNLNEKPFIDPFDGELKGTSIVEKLDGSTLIVSRFRGENILRTRGTIDASGMPNAAELEVFKSTILPKLPKDHTLPVSYIFEWTSPINKIIINYGEAPKFYLTNIIKHEDYTLTPQEDLDKIATELDVLRPKRYQYYSLSHLLKDVDKDETFEGVCLYYNNDQNIRKIKSAWYLKLHSFKGNCSFRTIVDLYLQWGLPSIENFKDKVEKEFDFECLVFASPLIDLFYSGAVEKVKTSKEVALKFFNENKDLPKKEYALLVNKTLSAGDYTMPMAFKYKTSSDLADIEVKALREFVEQLRESCKNIEPIENT